MKALDFRLLADENIHPEVISLLRDEGIDVESVTEQAGMVSLIGRFYNRQHKQAV